MRVRWRPPGRTARRRDTTRPSPRPIPLFRVPFIRFATMALALVCAGPARAQDEAKAEIETCLSCHSDDSLSVTFADGRSHSLAVSADAFAQSVHGGNLKCTDCHGGLDENPTPGAAVQGPRAVPRVLSRSLQDLPLRQLHAVARQRSRHAAGAGRHPRARLRRLPRLARHRAGGQAARRDLAHLRTLPRGGVGGVRPERSRHVAPRRERRRAGVHRLPSLARHRRPANLRVAGEDAGALRQVPHEQAAHGETRAVAERARPISPTSTA